MSVKDALLFNTTGSNFQALQTDDTARIKGDLSLQKDDGTWTYFANDIGYHSTKINNKYVGKFDTLKIYNLKNF